MIEQRLQKCFPDFVAHGLARKFPHGFLHLLPKIVVVFRPARETDDRHRGRQFAISGKIVECRNQFPMGQIAGGAEDHDRARLRHRARGQSFAQRIHLLLLCGTIHESKQITQTRRARKPNPLARTQTLAARANTIRNPTTYPGSGNLRVSSRTLSRTRFSADSSVRFCSASAIRSEISSISSSFMPRVVTAGVPTRMPPGLKGELLSNGIAFLFTVMPARSSVSCASLPFKSFGRRSTSMRWLSVPPETIRKPCLPM